MDEFINQILSKKEFFLAEIKVLQEHGNLDDNVKAYQAICRWLEQLVQDVQDYDIPEACLDVLAKTIREIPVYINLDSTAVNRISPKLFEEDDLALHNAFNAWYSYDIWKQLGFLKENVVLIGVNGSGKSTLAQLIQSTLPSKNGIVINAQKYLIIPTLNSIPSYNRVLRKLNEFQKKVIDDKRTFEISEVDGFDYGLSKELQQGFNVLLSGLLGERILKRNRYCTRIQNGENTAIEEMMSILDKVIEIWNDLMADKKLFCDDNDNQLKIKVAGIDSYPAYRMSDGEKVILYMLGRTLQAPSNSYIIVDEPETYLHKAIVDKLWNRIEQERGDCKFAYLTHDLSFALSRGAKILWVKSFKYPASWEILPVEENIIPDELLLKLLGSKKKILFCEGNNSGSLDHQIFELLFPNYTITPVESCHDVINYVRSFNQIPSKSVEAIGIIDRDFRAPSQIDKLVGEGIYCYNVAEIENLFLNEQFLARYLDYMHETDIEKKLTKIKERVIDLLEKHIEQQASMYVSARIDYHYKTANMSQGKTLAEIKSCYHAYSDQISIDDWYHERFNQLENICKNKEYEKAILVYNNKGLQGCVETEIGLRANQYRIKALAYLKQAPEDVKDILRSVFPKEIMA